MTGLPRAFAAVVAIVVTPVLATLVVFGWLMVISGDAALLIAAIMIAAAALALAGAALVARRLAADQAARMRADEARRDLVAAVSHDLRTPITSLRLLADAIDDDIVTGDQRRSYLARMSTHISALGALIDDLFELSRLEAGDIGWSLQQISIDELVRETVEAMRVEAETQGISVSADLARDLGTARANPEKLQRVLFNLIQNAIRHTPADGSIVVHAESTATGLEIEVADTGDGISAADRGRVFGAFYRGGTDAARTGEGAGLGLAISRAIVEAHGGRMWLADSSRGTRVRFSLPAASRREVAIR
ncbi:MAG TPA: HAMP domain-containing sensor histidine kinase [Solirubrobacteraceae bacterium]|nr:HAMP domain-containing sensor histidine kinase [Solirubrobacteraceae bacterium]